MMRVIRSGLPVLAATLLAASLAPAAQAAPVSRYEGASQLDGKPLVLNGAGTRYRVVLKVYDLGLYLPRKAATVDEVLAMPGPKKLQFVALRELPGTDLGVAFIKGLSENSPKEQVQKHSVSTTRLIEIFSGKTKMMPGETFAMDYVPGKGTTFVIAGQAQGAPVGDAEFFNMVLRIWLGNSPVDRLLKDNLLGQERPTP